jgi:hypothetical protein
MLMLCRPSSSKRAGRRWEEWEQAADRVLVLVLMAPKGRRTASSRKREKIVYSR